MAKSREEGPRIKVVENWLRTVYGWHRYHERLETIDIQYFASKMLRELDAAKPAKRAKK